MKHGTAEQTNSSWNHENENRPTRHLMGVGHIMVRKLNVFKSIRIQFFLQIVQLGLKFGDVLRIILIDFALNFAEDKRDKVFLEIFLQLLHLFDLMRKLICHGVLDVLELSTHILFPFFVILFKLWIFIYGWLRHLIHLTLCCLA